MSQGGPSGVLQSGALLVGLRRSRALPAAADLAQIDRKGACFTQPLHA